MPYFFLTVAVLSVLTGVIIAYRRRAAERNSHK